MVSYLIILCVESVEKSYQTCGASLQGDEGVALKYASEWGYSAADVECTVAANLNAGKEHRSDLSETTLHR